MTDIVFKGADHKRRFLAAVQGIDKVYGGDSIDQEYGAALFVLTSDLRTWEQAQSYVERDSIDFEGLLQDLDWSGGYRVLLQWAANLFNEHAANCNPVELMRLDEGNFEVALSALRIRRGGLHFERAELYNAAMDERNRMSQRHIDKPWLPLHDGE